MLKVAQTHSEVYPSVAASVPLARHAVDAFAGAAGATTEERDAVRLAVSEAVTNAVEHAYAGGPGNVELRAFVASRELWILVADDGGGLRADARSRGLGLGLALIALVTDDFTIAERASGGLEVRMGFKLGAMSNAHGHRRRRGSRGSATRPASSRFVVAA